MAYNKKHSPVIIEWFDQVRHMNPADELWLPCDNKSHQSSLKTQFYSLRKEFQINNPVEGEKLSFAMVNRLDPVSKTCFWIKAYKKAVDPTLAWIKRGGGKNKPEEIRITVEPFDPKKDQNIRLMLEEGMEINAIKQIYTLNLEEEALYESIINQNKDLKAGIPETK